GWCYEAVARAAPDGNTLVINANSFVINPHLRKVNYDPLTSYEPICYLLSSPQVIVVNSDAPYRTLAEFITDAHAKPGQLLSRLWVPRPRSTSALSSSSAWRTLMLSTCLIQGVPPQCRRCSAGT